MKSNLVLHKEMWSQIYRYYKCTPMKEWVSIHDMKASIITVWKMEGYIGESPVYNCFLCHEYCDIFACGYDAYKCGLCPLATRDVSRPCKYYKEIIDLTEAHEHKRGDKKKLLELIAKVRDIIDEQKRH